MTKLAVVGCGHWGPNHIRNFNSLPDTQVSRCVDMDAERLRKIGAMFPGVQTSADFREILDDPSIQAVVIATPTNTHFKLSREALSAGKHVLCEKPLSETADEARELANLARATKLVLMVGHVFLYNPGIIRLKEALGRGELGKLFYLAAVRTNLGPIREDVNASQDLASHDISIFNWLLDSEPEWVSAMGSAFLRPLIEDVVFLSLKYPNGVCAGIHASWLNPKKVRQITVVGSRKMATWDDLELNTPLAIYDKGANINQEYRNYGEFLRVSMWDGDVKLPKIQSEEPLKAQAQEFIRCIERRENSSRSNGDFALGVVRVLDAANKSLKQNGAPLRVAP